MPTEPIFESLMNNDLGTHQLPNVFRVLADLPLLMSSTSGTTPAAPAASNNTLTLERLMGVLRVLSMLCHGNATPAAEDQCDEERPLSPIGHVQVENVRAGLQDVVFDAVISSPLIRAKTTTLIATCQDPTVFGILGVSRDPADPLNVMFKELKSSTLEAYFSHELGQHLKGRAGQALLEILELFENDGLIAGNVLMGSDAVMIPAIGWIIGKLFEEGGKPEVGIQVQNLMLKTQLREAEMISFDFKAVEPAVILAWNDYPAPPTS